MLLAVGADPRVCGYRGDQINAVGSSLVEKGLHQERPAVAQLALWLSERGVIDQPRIGAVMAAAHGEVTKLRFHPERSPMRDLPVSLRRGLYPLLLEHAEGAVKRVGRQWVDFDLSADPDLVAPYSLVTSPHEQPRPVETGRSPKSAEEDPERAGSASSGGRDRSGSPAKAKKDGVLWGELTWPEAKKRLRAVDIALLPVGAIEQHGHHLPLDTDSFDADYLARAVAERCSQPRPLVLPLLPYGVSYHHDDFPGTISVGNETLARMVYDVGVSAGRCGVKKLVIINGHGGNGPTLNFAAQRINRDVKIFTCVDSGETSDTDVYALIETPNDVHAGEVETSTSLAVRPELVQMDRATASVPRFSSQYLDFTSDRGVDWYAMTSKISKTGVLGDPTKASRDKGERIWELQIHHLVQLVEHLKRLDLEEIYERRF